MNRSVLSNLSGCLPGAVIALAIAFQPAPAASNEVPSWRKPLPRTAAFLDAAIGYDMAVVCDTAAQFLVWWGNGSSWESETFPGCKKFAPGLPAIIQEVVADPPRDANLNSSVWSPLVKILIPSRQVEGYTILQQGLRPDIPQGTIVHIKRDGKSVLRFPPSQDADIDSGPDLGEQAAAKVIQFEPSNYPNGLSSNFDLYVTLVDGVWAGTSGWISSRAAIGGDGEAVGTFAESDPKPVSRIDPESCDNVQPSKPILCSPNHGRMPIFLEGGAAKQGFDLMESGVATRHPDLLAPLLACVVSDATPVWIVSSGWNTTTVLVRDGPAIGCRGDTRATWVK